MSSRICFAFFVVFFLGCSCSVATGQPTARSDKQLGPSSSRVPWTGSKIEGSPEPPLPYTVERAFPRQQFEEPTSIIGVPGTDRLIVTQLPGKVVSFRSVETSTDQELAIDLAKSQPDLFQVLGIAFHPDYPEIPVCFLTYAVNETGPYGTRLSKFRVTDTAVPTLDPQSEQILMSWQNGGHKGGCLKFGPEGYLYVAVGDGAPHTPPDSLKTGQDISDLQASILRIDIDRAQGDLRYGIPADNPFVDVASARAEIWAYGLRNPWKMCFDPKSGALWAADVGWDMMEMVFRVEKGGNYGWSVMEGSQVVQRDAKRGPTPILPPIVEHTHVESRSITGGYFYFGQRLPELQGAYIYGDYVTGKVWGLKYDGESVTWHEELADTPLEIVCFALGADGELYLVDFDGTLHRMKRNVPTEANRNFPRRLSETGLFVSTKDLIPAPGVIPYSINAEHWADHTRSTRVAALPGTTRLTIFPKEDVDAGQIKGAFSFPHNSVLAKTVSLELDSGDPASSRRLETQILHWTRDSWRAYNYIWNDEQTDAVLMGNEGRDQTFLVKDEAAPGGVRDQVWHHASRDECLLCHVWKAGTVHGFKLSQLDDKRLTAADTESQLSRLVRLGIIEGGSLPSQQSQISPYDASANLDERARSYLQLNCAHCHRLGGGGTASFDVREALLLQKTRMVGVVPSQGDFGISAAKIISPGDPYRSILYLRMAKSGRGHMPQFGANVIDTQGVRLVRTWIASLEDSGVVDPVVRERNAEFGSVVQQLAAAEETDVVDAKIQRLFSSSRGALMLMEALDDGRISRHRDTVAELALVHTDPVVRDLFERFLPREKRVRRLSDPINTAALLSMKGDPERGRRLFSGDGGVTCRNCHRIKDDGIAVGPDLSGVGAKYTKREILENILDPSKKIDPKYSTYYVLTATGLVHTGVLLEDTESELALRSVDGERIVISKDQIQLVRRQERSIMPERLFHEFTAQQAADLLEFLSSLKESAGETR